MTQNTGPVNEIEVPAIISTADEMKGEGYRLAAITAATVEGKYEVTYSFGLDGNLCHYRVVISPGDVLPSISGIYPGAFVYENEMHDLFGIEVHGLRLDYGGTFFRTHIRYPFGVSAARWEKEENP